MIEHVAPRIGVGPREVPAAGAAVPRRQPSSSGCSRLPHPGQACTRDLLLRQVCSFGEKYLLERMVDAHVAKVGGKLREAGPGCEPTTTMRAAGYRLEAPSQ